MISLGVLLALIGVAQTLLGPWSGARAHRVLRRQPRGDLRRQRDLPPVDRHRHDHRGRDRVAVVPLPHPVGHRVAGGGGRSRRRRAQRRGPGSRESDGLGDRGHSGVTRRCAPRADPRRGRHHLPDAARDQRLRRRHRGPVEQPAAHVRRRHRPRPDRGVHDRIQPADPRQRPACRAADSLPVPDAAAGAGSPLERRAHGDAPAAEDPEPAPVRHRRRRLRRRRLGRVRSPVEPRPVDDGPGRDPDHRDALARAPHGVRRPDLAVSADVRGRRRVRDGQGGRRRFHRRPLRRRRAVCAHRRPRRAARAAAAGAIPRVRARSRSHRS